jgi:hypothetical protein
MNRQNLIKNTLDKINQLPDIKVKEINEYADLLISRIDDNIIRDGIQEITSQNESFDFLNQEEDIYTVQDLKVRYK